jgi:hypothetical protein
MTEKLAKSSLEQYTILYPLARDASPWGIEKIDKLELTYNTWKNVVDDCRYFYKRDPFVSTVINKIVDLSINDLIIHEGDARKSIKDIVEAIKPNLLMFMRSAALEYLLSGLVIPEVTFENVEKDDLQNLGIKRFSKLSLPTDMWLRDPSAVVIKSPLIGGRKSYFVKIPEEMKVFITNEGRYSDGNVDKDLYETLVKEMPEFVASIKAGKTEILLDNPLVIQYRTLAGETYPTPYLMPALESLRHKRNLRRMDYSLASRVITAIQLIKMGNDEYPLTEDNQDQLEELKKQMRWRNDLYNENVERIFQLFSNHTVSIEWIMPDVRIILEDTKYKSVNHDIAIALGFPNILVTGETERSFVSDPQIATISPLQTMYRIRESIFPIIKRIIDTIVLDNNLGGTANVQFKPINMMASSQFVDGITALFDSGNLSKQDFAAVFGFDWFGQIDKMQDEQEILKESGLKPPQSKESPKPNSGGPKFIIQTKPEKPTTKPSVTAKKPAKA